MQVKVAVHVLAFVFEAGYPACVALHALAQVGFLLCHEVIVALHGIPCGLMQQPAQVWAFPQQVLRIQGFKHILHGPQVLWLVQHIPVAIALKQFMVAADDAKELWFLHVAQFIVVEKVLEKEPAAGYADEYSRQRLLG